MSEAPEEISFQVFASLPRPAELGGEVLLGMTGDQRFVLVETADGKQRTLINPLTLAQAMVIAEGALIGEARFTRDPMRTATALAGALLVLEALLKRGGTREGAEP